MDNSDRDCNVDPRRLRTALGELAHDLAQAGEKLDVDRRGAWIHAVAAVWLFVDKLDYYDRERRKAPFATLAGALQALDRGTIDPGLQPTERRPGRPPDPPDVALVRSMAAAWMHFLVQAGQDKAAAGRAVARVLNREGVRLGKRSNVSIEQAGRTVEKWRERLEEGSDQTEAVDFYKFIK